MSIQTTEGLTKHGPPAEAHIQAIMQEYQITRTDLLGPRKDAYCMPARQQLYVRLLCDPFRWVAGEPVYRSLPQVGKIVGKRDHTTVLYGLRRYAVQNLDLRAKPSVAEIREAVHALETVMEAA
jgi:chromosomal replication initiation ATPase DnaA